MKRRQKKPVVAWISNTAHFDTLDGMAVVAARTERGARGRVRRSALEAGFVVPHRDIAVDRLGPLDAWIAAQRPDVAWNLSIALFQAQDALKEAIRTAMAATFVAMRKEGLGLSMGQEEAMQRGLGL